MATANLGERSLFLVNFMILPYLSGLCEISPFVPPLPLPFLSPMVLRSLLGDVLVVVFVVVIAFIVVVVLSSTCFLRGNECASQTVSQTHYGPEQKKTKKK